MLRERRKVCTKEWKAKLDRMAFCLSEMKPTSSTEDKRKMRKYRENMKKEGFTLLCENFEKLG